MTGLTNISKRVCVVTGSRADYGLQYQLLNTIQDCSNLELQLLVTGSHLASQYGLTYTEIEQDGIKIDGKIDMLLASDSVVATTKSMGLSLIGFAEQFERLEPDIVLILGDRFEVLMAAIAASMASLPIAHMHGGETTLGAIDDNFRHAITKLAHIHFAATDEYKDRIVQMGESPVNVFNVGGVGIDNIQQMTFLTQSEIENDLDIVLGDSVYLITYHPVTRHVDSGVAAIKALLEALDILSEESTLIFTMPNADPDNQVIANEISKYVKTRKNSHAFGSLGRVRYLSLLNIARAVIGNSSSGIIEAPSFGIPTLNIGDRQAGRVRAESVIDTRPDLDSIQLALRTIDSLDCSDVINPYGEGGAAKKIVETLCDKRLDNILIKEFFNIAKFDY